MLVHVDEYSAVVRCAAVDVVVEGPDQLNAGVRVGDIQCFAVRAERHAVGHDQLVQSCLHWLYRCVRRRVISVKRTHRLGAHVCLHRTGPEAPLAVATPVIETHAGPRVFDAGALVGNQATVSLGGEVEDPALHGPKPVALLATDDAAEHFVCGPVTGLAIWLPAVQAACRYIHPVQGIFLRVPDRAFACGIACIGNQFGCHGRIAHSIRV
ncbi:hypothetical protein D3C80_996980 [compost metagenome]